MDAIDGIMNTKICVFMKQGFGYTTATGVEFSHEQPFQMMDAADGEALMRDNPDRFRLAQKDEVIEFFSNNKNTGPKRMQMV